MFAIAVQGFASSRKVLADCCPGCNRRTTRIARCCGDAPFMYPTRNPSVILHVSLNIMVRMYILLRLDIHYREDIHHRHVLRGKFNIWDCWKTILRFSIIDYNAMPCTSATYHNTYLGSMNESTILSLNRLSAFIFDVCRRERISSFVR